MPYLNVDDGMDEHPKVEGLTDAAFRQLMRDLCLWSRTGVIATDLVRELLEERVVRRAPRHWLPERIQPRYRARIPAATRSLVYGRDGWSCKVCGSRDRLSIDHIVPWSLGGSDEPENLQTLCMPCNSRKGARV